MKTFSMNRSMEDIFKDTGEKCDCGKASVVVVCEMNTNLRVPPVHLCMDCVKKRFNEEGRIR